MAEHVYHLEDQQTKLVKTNMDTGEKTTLIDKLDPRFAVTLLTEIQFAYFQGRFDADLTTGRITAASRAEAKRPPKNNFL